MARSRTPEAAAARMNPDLAANAQMHADHGRTVTEFGPLALTHVGTPHPEGASWR